MTHSARGSTTRSVPEHLAHFTHDRSRNHRELRRLWGVTGHGTAMLVTTHHPNGVHSLMDRMAAYGAVDPGSIPGGLNFCARFLFLFRSGGVRAALVFACT